MRRPPRPPHGRPGVTSSLLNPASAVCFPWSPVHRWTKVPATWNRPSHGPVADYSHCRCAVCHRAHSRLRYIYESDLRFRFLGQEISRCAAGATEANLKNDAHRILAPHSRGLRKLQEGFCKQKERKRSTPDKTRYAFPSSPPPDQC